MLKYIIILFFSNYLFFLNIPLLIYFYLRKNYNRYFYLLITLLAYAGPMVVHIFKYSKISWKLLLCYYLSLILTYIIVNKYSFSCQSEDSPKNKNYITTEGNALLKEILHVSFDNEGLSQGGEKICNIVKEHYGISFCSLFLYSSRHEFKLISSNIDEGVFKEIEKFINTSFKDKEEDAFILCSDTCLDYPSANERNIRYSYFIPLKMKGRINGAILLEDVQRYILEPQDEALFDIMLENISVVLQNLIYEDKLYAAANLDGLTQVGNRRYMEKMLKEQIEHHKNTGCTFSLVIFDIDHFKRFNDSYGHLIGDKALKITSSFIKKNIRKDEDEVFRYGGEEFIIFFSNTNNKTILNKVDALRKGFSKLIINTGIENEITNITASFGVAEYPRHGKTVKELIESADKALYYSKNNGRNQVTDYSLLELGEKN